MIKPTLFHVTRTPKGIDNVLDVSPSFIKENYCAVINVSDSPCATFDYQREGIPSFWFPIDEIGQWGYSPFYGTLRVVNEYYKGDKPLLIHCHAGANRSPSVAFAILMVKGYTVEEAERELNYDNLKEVFFRNIERKNIPEKVIEFLKIIDEGEPTMSIAEGLRRVDRLYDEWAQKKYDEQNDYTLKANSDNPTRLVYNKETKRFVIVKPWIDPKIVNSFEWNATPIVPPGK